MVRLLLIFYFIVFQSFGQQIKFENFTTSEGLSNNSVVDIENDKDGGLWVATWDGLNYFDGYSFKVYKHSVNNPKTISSNYLLNIEKDANGFIWTISKEGNINRYIGNGEFESFKFKTIPESIKLSLQGNIVVKTNNDYYEYLNGSFEKKPYKSVEKEDYRALKHILLAKFPSLTINDVLKDKTGNIWFATLRNGIYIIPNSLDNLNNTQIDHYTYDLYLPYAFKSNEIEKLHEDDFGNIWIGQKDGGLSMAYTGSEKISLVVPHPVKYPHLPNETIRAITKDNTGRIWLGYYNNGLYFYSDETHCYQKFKVKEASLNTDWNRIRTLFTASDGSIWVGTYAGVLRIKANEYVCYEASKIKELPNNRNYSIYEDKDKQLWIACWGGLAKFNLKKNTFETFNGQDLLTDYHIRCVKKKGQSLILGTEKNGVLILDLYNKALEHIKTEDGILGNSIYSIYIDNVSDNYWIASLGGISIFNREKKIIKNITEVNGLPSHMVYGLLANKDEVWLSTTKGIATIKKDDFKITTFDPNQGWQASEFSEGAYYQDAKGVLFFGGVNGLNCFNPTSIQFSNSKSKIKLLVDGSETYASTIEKSYRDNQLNIELVPIRFPKKNKIDIYYKLEGKDENWNLLDTTNKIKYTNLASGNYGFLVKEGKNSIAEPVLFSIHIRKAFYETILFYVSLTIFFLIASIVFIHFKNRKTAAKQIYLEAQIAERTKVIENQKKDIHTVNVMLNEKNKKILMQKEKLIKLHNNLKNEDFEIEKFKIFVLSQFQEPISKIIKISNTLKDDSLVQRDLIHQSSKLVNLISEWNYLDYVKDIGSIKISAINLLPVLKSSIKKFKKYLQSNNVSFNCEIDATIGWVEVDVLRFRLLLQYFFNAIGKYSDTSINLNIGINHKSNFLEIQLKSNSTILKNNWYSIVHYSPYFKALEVLLEDLKGVFVNSYEADEEFKVVLQIPLTVINPEMKLTETISWKHFNQQENLVLNKQNVLVYTKEENYATAIQVLENENYNLFFENSVNNLNSALKQVKIEALVFYQAAFSKELMYFLNFHKKDTNRIKIPLIYISEEINYELQEQSVELAIDTLIQLPVSKIFITKKIKSLINKKQKVIEENEYQQKIFGILTEKCPITTSNDKLLKKGLDFIKKELHNPSFNVEMLVEQLGISRVKCYRLFKETLKQSPSDIITSLRLQKAESLLKTNKLNISEVSFECGYNDPKYFGRSFKKYSGKSPKEFKKHIAQ